jgi:hypothetical protein
MLPCDVFTTYFFSRNIIPGYRFEKRKYCMIKIGLSMKKISRSTPIPEYTDELKIIIDMIDRFWRRSASRAFPQ